MTTSQKHKQIYNFTAVFEKATEGGYVVHVPSLPGCYTQGETFEEAEKMGQEAIELYIETLQDLKEEIPQEDSDKIIVSKIPARV